MVQSSRSDPAAEEAKKVGADCLAGDIFTFDTGIQNGTAFDHIGIAADDAKAGAKPWVINIWDVGFTTCALPVQSFDFVKLKGHFRLTHPFAYQ